MIDQYDRLLVACDLAARYPTNLTRTGVFSHILQLYKIRLQENEKQLFEARSKYHAIDLLEAYDGDSAFVSKTCKSTDSIREHLQKNRKDPRCRHVFIQAESSRSPLDCSKSMFEYILSFHQVSPSFLELVLGFGRGKQPQDFHYTGFRHESFLDKSEADTYAIKRLGRSGREIKQSYNLWSVESTSNSRQSWAIRQTAVYHSFDVDTGRSFWISIKANDVIKTRTMNETTSSNKLCAHGISDPSRCFAATLRTHLIHFEWCRENWRLYIACLQKRLDDVLKKVYVAPVDLVERDLAVNSNELIQPLKMGKAVSPTLPSRAATFGSEASAFSRQTTGLSIVTKPVISNIATAISSPASMFTPVTGNLPQQTRLPSAQESNTGERNTFEIFEQFSIEELQRLYRIGSTLQEANLVMKLNTDVLLEIEQSYDRLINDNQFPHEIRDECSTAIKEFFEHSKYITKDIEREQRRVATLIEMLDNGKTMFEAILQFRNVEMNKLFTLHAHLTGQRTEYMTREMHKSTIEMEHMTKSMHKIAEKTERETASMHIITFVTLIFLPGTFIAVRIGISLLYSTFACGTSKLKDFLLTCASVDDQTFFGSGIFQWNQNNPAQPSPVLKGEFFALFAKICLPLMAGTILIWLGAYWWATRHRVNKDRANTSSDDEEKV